MQTPELEALLRQLVQEVRDLKEIVCRPLPTVLTKRRAAQELGVSLSKLKGLIRTGQLATCMVGETALVPASEVKRIAESARKGGTTKPPRPERVRAKRARLKAAPSEAEKIRAALKRTR